MIDYQLKIPKTGTKRESRRSPPPSYPLKGGMPGMILSGGSYGQPLLFTGIQATMADNGKSRDRIAAPGFKSLRMEILEGSRRRPMQV